MELVKELITNFERIEVENVPREKNNHVDALANLGSTVESSSARAIPLVIAQWPTIWMQIF